MFGLTSKLRSCVSHRYPPGATNCPCSDTVSTIPLSDEFRHARSRLHRRWCCTIPVGHTTDVSERGRSGRRANCTTNHPQPTLLGTQDGGRHRLGTTLDDRPEMQTGCLTRRQGGAADHLWVSRSAAANWFSSSAARARCAKSLPGFCPTVIRGWWWGSPGSPAGVSACQRSTCPAVQVKKACLCSSCRSSCAPVVRYGRGWSDRPVGFLCAIFGSVHFRHSVMIAGVRGSRTGEPQQWTLMSRSSGGRFCPSPGHGCPLRWPGCLPWAGPGNGLVAV